jgi:hypothetical protein
MENNAFVRFGNVSALVLMRSKNKKFPERKTLRDAFIVDAF